MVVVKCIDTIIIKNNDKNNGLKLNSEIIFNKFTSLNVKIY